MSARALVLVAGWDVSVAQSNLWPNDTYGKYRIVDYRDMPYLSELIWLSSVSVVAYKPWAIEHYALGYSDCDRER